MKGQIMKISSLIETLKRAKESLGDGVIVGVVGINGVVNVCEPDASSVMIKLKVDFCDHKEPLDLTVSNGIVYYEDRSKK